MKRIHLLRVFLALVAGGAGLTALPDAVAAQVSPLSPEQISAFNAQVVQARQTQKWFSDSETCLTLHNTALQARGSELESALAADRRLEQTLALEVTRLDEEQRQFASISQTEQSNLDSRQQDLDSALNEQQEQDRRLEECRRALTILSFLCDWGDQAVRDLGWMRNVRAEIDGIRARLDSAHTGLRDAEWNLAESQTALVRARDQAAANQVSIRQIEDEIVQVKRTISTLHEMTGTYNTLLDDLANLLEQADAVDPESARARQIARLSSEVADLVSRAPAAISSAGADLPDPVKHACSIP